jgi:DNA-binding transcriptional LysR family regulator
VSALRTPDIEELRTFCAAAELGSLGRASVRLNVSQPGLSKRVAHLEAAAGAQLFERSTHGMRLTPAGRRLYEEARRLLQQADLFEHVLQGVRHEGGPIRLACSHSAMEGLVAQALAGRASEDERTIELVLANSSVVRDLVADSRADLGVAASRPNRTPYPGARELPLVDDAIVCAVPEGHPWARRQNICASELVATPMVMRDPASNSRWTLAAVLREHGLALPPILAEAGTPQTAIREARARRAPVLLSRAVLRGHGFCEVPIAGLAFPRSFVLLLPAQGEPSTHVCELMDELRRQAGADPPDPEPHGAGRTGPDAHTDSNPNGNERR